MREMSKRPTISDLAQASGVSIATVDRVLNRRLPVREDTVSRVVAAAERIGFHASGLLRRRLVERPKRAFVFLLQKRHDPFYQALGEALAQATRESAAIEGKPVIEFTEELAPAHIASRLLAAGARADAVALVSVDHPLVNEAVETLAARGKPVFTLLSDLTTPARTGYFAVESRKAGRTAGWAISRCARKPGKVAVLVGSHRYLSQDTTEISFRSYMREHAPDFHVLESLINLDDDRITYEAVVNLVAGTPDLSAIYVAGGGRDGMIRALAEEKAGHRIFVVCNELVPATRSALIDGAIDLVLATPAALIAPRLVAAMARACDHKLPLSAGENLFPAEIYLSENI
jgi:LacI family transcriptional regulator